MKIMKAKESIGLRVGLRVKKIGISTGITIGNNRTE